MRKGNRGKFSHARSMLDKNTNQLAGEKALVGLTAKLVSHAPPRLKNQSCTIQAIHNKSVDITFFNVPDEMTVPLHALHIYTQDGQTVRFK